MRYFLALLLMVISCRAASPSFSSFNQTQFLTNNPVDGGIIISIKDGASVTNITNTRSGASSPSSVATLGDLLWRNVASIATLTNTMEGAEISHDVSAGDDDDVYFEMFATIDGTFNDYGDLYITISTNSGQATLSTTAGGVETSAIKLISGNGSGSIRLELNGALTDGFFVNSPSGYTGGGTLFLSDDGTYKAAGGVGDSIWTNITGYVTMIDGQTATNTLAFVSGATDNLTNLVLRLDTANMWSGNDEPYLTLGLAGTNFMQVPTWGGWTIGRDAMNQWGAQPGVVSFFNTSLGEPSGSEVTVGVTDGGSIYNYATIFVSTNAAGTTLEISPDGTVRTKFSPGVVSSGSAVAYKFDTSNYLNTSGDLLSSFGNAGTNRFLFYPSSLITSGAWAADIVGTPNYVGSVLVGDQDIAGSPTYAYSVAGLTSGGLVTYGSELISDVSVQRTTHEFKVSQGGTSFAEGITLDADDEILLWTLGKNGGFQTIFQPAIYTGDAYILSTANSLTNGDKFVSIQNAGTEVLNISPNSTGAQIVFGPGSTNVLYRSGTDLIYTNGMTGVTTMYFKVVNGAGNELQLGQNAGGVPQVKSSTANLYFNQTGGNGGLFLGNSAFGPQTAGTLDNGQFASAWATLSLTNEIRWQMSGVATNLLIDAWGTATPEGAKTALPGSVFRNTAGVLSVKTDGTGTAGWQPVHVGNQAYLAANGTVSDATLINLSLSVGVTSGKKYAFRCVLYCANSTAGDGVKIDFDGGSAAATNFRAHTKITDAALLTSTQTSALATDITAATITGDTEIEVNGSFEPSGTGTLIPRFAENADGGGTLTVYRGSHLILTEIP